MLLAIPSPVIYQAPTAEGVTAYVVAAPRAADAGKYAVVLWDVDAREGFWARTACPTLGDAIFRAEQIGQGLIGPTMLLGMAR